MLISLKRKFLYIYFLFQCLMIPVSFLIFILITFITQTDSLDFKFYFNLFSLPIVLSQINFLTTVVCTIATWKIIKNENMTKLEILSEIFFPIFICLLIVFVPNIIENY